MAADSSFNVQRWLKAVGFSSRTAAAFTGHGYVSYERCVNLSEEDVRAVVKSDYNVRLLMNRVKELRQFTEEDAVKLLSSQNMSLYIACRDGDVKLAEQLITNGANVNWRNPLHAEYTPVLVAARYGNVDLLNMLIDAGGDVNIANVNQYTPAHIAAYKGHVDILKTLHKHGAQLNTKDNLNNTPLDEAVRMNHSSVVEFFKAVEAAGTQNRNLVMQYIERQGSLPVRSMKSFLIGPPCVGKTSARRRLMGEIEHISRDEIVPSTGIDAPLTVRLQHPTEHSSVLLSEGWHSQGLEKQCRALCSYALNSPASLPVLSSSRSATPPPPVSPGAARSHRINPLSKLINLAKRAFSRRSQPTVTTTQDAAKPTHDTATATQDAAEATHDTATAAQEELTTALTTLVKEDDWMSIRDFLTNVKELAFLNIVDIGGQPEFHEILPLLLHGLALNLIFLNTTQDLDSPYTVVYRDGTGNNSPQYTSESTIRQVIQRALCAISSLQTSDDENKSAAILIGTYCDLADKSAVLALDQSIQESFKEADFMKKDVLCAVNKPGEKRRYVYPLDNVSGDPSEIDELRQLISTIVYDRFKPVHVPTSALLLHLILRMKFGHTRGWCTLEECIEIAKKCGISKEDLLSEDGILQYLHDKFGTVLYYRKVNKLCLRVIVNTNVIMGPPSRLFVLAFGALKTEQQTAEHIRATGEISQYLMTKVCSPDDDHVSDDDIPTNEIVELLKARYIIFEDARSYSTETVYFMPALLYPDHNVAKESSNPDLLASLPFPPVVFLASSGDVPLGQFPATAVNLSKQWKPSEKNRYRNRIQFYAKCKHDRFLHVELRNLSTHLEFRALSEPSIDTSLMVESIQKLRDVFAELLPLYSHTRYIEWSIGFYCSHSLQPGRQPHTATCNSKDNPQEMICSQRDCEGGLIPLNDKHKSWFTAMPIINTTTTATPPTTTTPPTQVPVTDAATAPVSSSQPNTITQTAEKTSPVVVTTASRPTMNELISMQKRDGSKGKLRIIKWITTHEPTQCDDFAHKLLVDKLSVREIRTKHQNDKEKFVRAVLERWISRDDDDEDEESLECTWEALVGCCHDAGLDGVFVKLLRDNVPK